MVNNSSGDALTCDAQHKKFRRAIKLVFNINGVTPDECYAILQLMNELPKSNYDFRRNTRRHITPR